MPPKKPPPRPRRVTTVIDELFDEQPTTPRIRRKECPECGSDVPLRDSGEFTKHNGPCGLQCISGGAPVGLPFHSRHCSHPTCSPILRVPIPGIPRKRRPRRKKQED